MQLKAVLKAISDPNHRVKALPLALLKICTNVKQDIKCSSAELVHTYMGQPFVPLECFHSSDHQQVDPISYVDKLKFITQKLQSPTIRSTEVMYVNRVVTLIPAHMFLS